MIVITYLQHSIETLSRIILNQAINFKTLPLFAALFLSFSCVDRYDLIPDEKSPELYDKVGFEAGKIPQTAGANSPISRVAPDYYYRQPSYPQVQNYTPQQQQMPQAYQQSPYAPQPYQQVQPYYQQQSQVYYRPQQVDTGSRFYSNPYAIPPAPQAPQANRYDADQFYVPPTYQTNVEPVQPIQNNRAVTY